MRFVISQQLLCLLLVAVPWPSFAQTKSVEFDRDIRPILSDKCFQCHGPDEQSRATELRFDQRESALKDLGGYRAIVPGRSDQSELIRRILSQDQDEMMPPPRLGKPLTAAEIQRLKEWIDAGAEWSEFWAYAEPRSQAIPTNESDWPTNWIDQFVYQRIRQSGFSPSEQADKTTLIRRLSFDLTGLPPSPEQVAEFLADNSDQAYGTLVNRLLESRHFGERMAIYWLDLVRYATTVGYHGDQDHNVAPYRDWVIDSLNQNMPFDQFTREQLAGDLLPSPTTSQRIATGYNRLLQTTHEGGLQPGEYRAIYAADRVRNFSAVWMAGTVGCAQCHDHKYDPYTMRDFYSLAAFFADIDDEQHFRVGTNANPTKRPPELFVLDDGDRQAEYDQLAPQVFALRGKIQKVQQQLKKLSSKKKLDEASLAQRDKLTNDLKRLQNDLKQIEPRFGQLTSIGRWTMVTESLAKPRMTKILPRGNWLDHSGPEVTPAIPSFLGQLQSTSQVASRLDLANWVTNPKSGFGKHMARVMANRIWYLLLGSGISSSLDDFGNQGQPPSMLELLDNLALHFVDSGWDLKDLVRLIVMSQTYRQSSAASAELLAADPYNQTFARQTSGRLPAEMVRDNALSIAGLLNLSGTGGTSSRPYQPAGYYQHLNFPKRKYVHDTNDQQWRRGVYLHWQRQFLHPAMKSLDAPSREECTAQRPRSNTPLAALVLLNDPSFVEAARSLAARVLRKHPNDFDEQLQFAFQLAVSRNPDSYERQVFKKLYSDARQAFGKAPARTKLLLETGISEIETKSDNIEYASWTSLARVLLNMDETITRN